MSLAIAFVMFGLCIKSSIQIAGITCLTDQRYDSVIALCESDLVRFISAS
jgi:hypothetical protein